MEINWHARFIEQARWTKSLRDYLLQNSQITPKDVVLEIGSGTGVISAEFLINHTCNLYGLDIDFSRCCMATRYCHDFRNINADAYSTPFSSGTFDLIFCHYFLLWLQTPELVLDEVFRILKPGGKFIAFAEPDYAARIDFPFELRSLGSLQNYSLQDQGVNLQIGRQLPILATAAGFSECRFGSSGNELPIGDLPDWWTSEWEVIQHDLVNRIDNVEMHELQSKDKQAWLSGSRVLWIPTFYLSCIKSN